MITTTYNFGGYAMSHQKRSFYDISIIADIKINVNIEIEPKQTKKEQSFGESEKYTKKWQYKKEQALKMSEKMYCAGYDRRAERMAECSDIVQLQYCHDCDSYQVKRANLCRDKLCPICNWRLSLRRMMSMMSIIDDYTENLREWKEHGGFGIKFDDHARVHEFPVITSLNDIRNIY